jgi:hypothetical protein
MMVYNNENHWVYELCQSFEIANNWKTLCFENWVCFRLQVRERKNA